jgi:hypothetical protein
MAEIAVGSYIFERLKQLGVKTVFGVPGGAYQLPLYWQLSPTLQTSLSHVYVDAQVLSLHTEAYRLTAISRL